MSVGANRAMHLLSALTIYHSSRAAQSLDGRHTPNAWRLLQTGSSSERIRFPMPWQSFASGSPIAPIPMIVIVLPCNSRYALARCQMLCSWLRMWQFIWRVSANIIARQCSATACAVTPRALASKKIFSAQELGCFVRVIARAEQLYK